MKKLVISITAASLLLASVGNSNVLALNSNVAQENVGEISTQAIPPWVKVPFKILLKKVGTGIAEWAFASEPHIYQYPKATHIESGSIKFNSGDFDAIAQKDIMLDQYVGQQVDIWATRPPFITGKIIAAVYRTNSSTALINKVLAPTQHLLYTSTSMGAYTIQYSVDESETWNCQLTYDHRLDTSLPQPDSVSEKQMDRIGDHIYLIPSATHKAESSSLKLKSQQKTAYSLSELYDQVFDSELNDYVYDFKDFNAGDKVVMKDIIKDINFDEKQNQTTFIFDGGKHGEVKWDFIGDLRDRFTIGDEINLQFTIEQLDGKYENLDYVNLRNNDEKVSIDSFLVK